MKREMKVSMKRENKLKKLNQKNLLPRKKNQMISPRTLKRAMRKQRLQEDVVVVEDAVDVGEEIDGGSSAVAGVVQPVAADGEPCAVWVIFFGSVVDDDPAVGDISPAVEGHVLFWNKENGVSSFDLAGHTLGQAAELLGV